MLIAHEPDDSDSALRKRLVEFEEYLNSKYAVAWVCGYDVEPARALFRIDRDLYFQEFDNWCWITQKGTTSANKDDEEEHQ